jgi:PAS domain S-box-containing protein
MAPADLDETAEELYDQAPCGYVTIEPGGAFRRANRTFLDWTGHDGDTLRGRRLHDVLSPGGRVYFETHLAPLLAMQGAVQEVALELLRPDGSRLPVLVNAVQRGDLVRMTLLDATQRRAYERELQQAVRRTERLQRVTATLAEPLAAAAIGAAVLDELVEETGADGGVVTLGPEVLARRGALGERHLLAELLGEEGRVGTLELSFPPERELSRTERELVAAVATQCAQALERVRRRAARDALLHATQERLASLEQGFWHLRKAQEVLPMCMGCRRVRDSDGGWEELHDFLLCNSLFVSHGLCDGCADAIRAS